MSSLTEASVSALAICLVWLTTTQAIRWTCKKVASSALFGGRSFSGPDFLPVLLMSALFGVVTILWIFVIAPAIASQTYDVELMKPTLWALHLSRHYVLIWTWCGAVCVLSFLLAHGRSERHWITVVLLFVQTFSVSLLITGLLSPVLLRVFVSVRH